MTENTAIGPLSENFWSELTDEYFYPRIPLSEPQLDIRMEFITALFVTEEDPFDVLHRHNCLHENNEGTPMGIVRSYKHKHRTAQSQAAPLIIGAEVHQIIRKIATTIASESSPIKLGDNTVHGAFTKYFDASNPDKITVSMQYWWKRNYKQASRRWFETKAQAINLLDTIKKNYAETHSSDTTDSEKSDRQIRYNALTNDEKQLMVAMGDLHPSADETELETTFERIKQILDKPEIKKKWNQDQRKGTAIKANETLTKISEIEKNVQYEDWKERQLRDLLKIPPNATNWKANYKNKVAKLKVQQNTKKKTMEEMIVQLCGRPGKNRP